MGKQKHNSDNQATTLSYVVRRAFTFAGRQYEPGEDFADPACDGEKLARLKVARLIELSHVVAEQSRRRGGPARPDKVVRNVQAG